jgi:hypothetical protein
MQGSNRSNNKNTSRDPDVHANVDADRPNRNNRPLLVQPTNHTSYTQQQQQRQTMRHAHNQNGDTNDENERYLRSSPRHDNARHPSLTDTLPAKQRMDSYPHTSGQNSPAETLTSTPTSTLTCTLRFIVIDSDAH